MPYRRILLGTDFSNDALEAARFAARMGAPGARHRLAFVTYPAPGDPSIEARDPEERAEARRRQESALDLVAQWGEGAGLKGVEPVVPRGSVAREMAREAEAFEADLVVVGSRGSSAERRLLGSTARAVARAVPCDVLVVRGAAPAPDKPAFRHVLVATDFESPSSAAADRALALATRHGAKMALVHAIDPGVWYESSHQRVGSEEGRTWLEKELTDRLHQLNRDRLGGKAAEHLVRGRPGNAIPRFAEENRADLVVVGTHGAGAIERLLLGSGAESILERSPCPVLIVRG